jgi:hypothetical protein
VEILAFGKSCPLANGNSERALSRNRRFDVFIQRPNVKRGRDHRNAAGTIATSKAKTG